MWNRVPKVSKKCSKKKHSKGRKQGAGRVFFSQRARRFEGLSQKRGGESYACKGKTPTPRSWDWGGEQKWELKSNKIGTHP